jgi:hypothetical protein
MILEFSKEAIFRYLQSKDFAPEQQKETDLIFIKIKADVYDVPIFFDIHQERGLLNMMSYLPFQLQEKSIAQVARLLHMINRHFDMPGWGMDEEHKFIFFRLLLPTLDNKLDERLLAAYIQVSSIACITFIHAIARVTTGLAQADDIFK